MNDFPDFIHHFRLKGTEISEVVVLLRWRMNNGFFKFFYPFIFPGIHGDHRNAEFFCKQLKIDCGPFDLYNVNHVDDKNHGDL